VSLKCYSKIPRVAVRVVPLYEAEMLELVERSTMDVSTVKPALVAPAGIVTLLGTLATPPLLLERAITAPPAGAGALNVIVPVDDSNPPITLDGLSVSEDSVATGTGTSVTVSAAVRVTPP
jgi:hypothetical protein